MQELWCQQKRAPLTDRNSIDATFRLLSNPAQPILKLHFPAGLEAASQLVQKNAVQQAELSKGSEQALTGISMFCRKIQYTGDVDKLFSAVHILHTSSSMAPSCAEPFSHASLLQLPACCTVLALTYRDFAEIDGLWY